MVNGYLAYGRIPTLILPVALATLATFWLERGVRGVPKNSRYIVKRDGMKYHVIFFFPLSTGLLNIIKNHDAQVLNFPIFNRIISKKR